MKACHADITTLRVDAIVNAANSSLLGGAGVDGAVHRAAGPELLEACKDIRRVDYPAGVPVGEAVMTPGFSLPARHVIHTVGPNWHRGETDSELLANAFRSCAELATRHGLTTIAYPAISAGAYGWDMERVARIGVAELAAFPRLDVTFALVSEQATDIWQREIRTQG
ncbi:macro domain-containing protein [Trueperella pecoris]|uniref:Macro domain-containing protein n=1 Tax=Trueperella pecoris TaxID=2733571 RepID=A0A7M1R0V2_9ACTO|nr:macro domain-containing protein [Trueperella pecoris]QOR47900.1 macro domain-containing protein [Trueperella pecoris]